MSVYDVASWLVAVRCDRGQQGLTWPMFQYSRSLPDNFPPSLLGPGTGDIKGAGISAGGDR